MGPLKTAAGRSSTDVAKPGWRVLRTDIEGDDEEYELVERISSSGEGVLWKARTVSRDGDGWWAVKILQEQHGDALDEWFARWKDTHRRTTLLNVTGIVPVAHAFLGPRPFPEGHGDGSDGPRWLYTVSRWVDGIDLERWMRRHGPGGESALQLISQLASIVDQIADAGWVHRDVSASNVLVEESGRVHLIDFAFLLVDGTTTRMQPSTPWTAPEALGHVWSTASDRYSVGALAVFLLTGVRLRPHGAAETARLELPRHGLGERTTDVLTQPLAREATERPVRLGPWVGALEAALADDGRAPRFLDIAVFTSGRSLPAIAVCDAAGVQSTTLRADEAWRLRPVRTGEHQPLALAAATAGDGRPRLFLLGADDGLWGGRSGADLVRLWDVDHSGRIGAVTSERGAAICFAVRDETLVSVELPLHGEPRVLELGLPATRVLAVGHDDEGVIVVLTSTRDGVLVRQGAAREASTVFALDAAAGAVFLDRLGRLECVVAVGNGGVLLFSEYDIDETWTPATRLTPPGQVVDLACVGHRDGATLAVAGPDGLWTSRRRAPSATAEERWSVWERLTDAPCSRVELQCVGALRIHLVALVDGVPSTAIDYGGEWLEPLSPLGRSE